MTPTPIQPTEFRALEYKRGDDPVVPTTLAALLAQPSADRAREACAALDAGDRPVFVTGEAGTGKTTWFRLLRDAQRASLLALAPTGVAALQIGGQTIHRAFGFPLRVLDPADSLGRLGEARREMLRAIDCLAIDEVSMVRPDILDGIDNRLRMARRNRRPFGGIRVLLMGDPLQLPPVVTPEDTQALRDLGYRGHAFFDAHVLAACPPRIVRFERVHRQRDPEFISVLRALRDGSLPPSVQAVLADRIVPDHHVDRSRLGGTDPDGAGRPPVTLTTRRRDADAINARCLARLPAPERTFRAEIVGDFPADAVPTPAVLALRRGARVMGTRNDRHGRWVNGSLGTVVGYRDGALLVRFDGRSTVAEVRPVTWERTVPQYDRTARRLVHSVVGTFTQFPLMPAWATTVHKAQGLTLDRVHIALGAGAFESGQVYVALSRCRTLGGLTLSRALRADDLRVDAGARAFLAGTVCVAERTSARDAA